MHGLPSSCNRMDVAEVRLRDDEPLAIALNAAELSKFCHYCLSQRNKSRLVRCCAKCKFVYYCSTECQANDWKDGHQVECRRVVSLCHKVMTTKSEINSADMRDSLIRLVARVVDKLQYLQMDRPSDPVLQAFANLKSIVFDIVDSHDESQRLRFDEFSESYARFVGRVSKKVDKVKLLFIYSKVMFNRIALKDGNQNDIGIGLYPNLCRIGHSCRPTAAIVFDQRAAIVIPTRSKRFPSPLNWACLSRCYPTIDPISTLQVRKDKLKAEYFIDCRCELCEDAATNEIMEALACSKKSCYGRVIVSNDAFICGKCGTVFDEHTRDKLFQAMQRIDSLFNAENSHRSLKHQLSQILDCAYSTLTVLHKYNAKRLTVLKAAYDGCVLEKRYKEALEFGRQSLEIYRYYLGEFDPFLIAFTLNLAVTFMHGGELNAASQLVLSNVDRCEHIYGKQSEILNYIDPSLEEMIANLSVSDTNS